MTRSRITRPSGSRTAWATRKSSPSIAAWRLIARGAGRAIKARSTRPRRSAPTIANDGGATRNTPQTAPPIASWMSPGRTVDGARLPTTGVVRASQARNTPPARRTMPTVPPMTTGANGGRAARWEARTCMGASSPARSRAGMTTLGQVASPTGPSASRECTRAHPGFSVVSVLEGDGPAPWLRRVGHPYHCGSPSAQTLWVEHRHPEPERRLPRVLNVRGTRTRSRRPAVVPLAALWAAILIALGLVVPVFAVEGPTKLFNPSVSPSSGLATTTIRFAVSYRNREGSPADHVHVVIDGAAHAMTADGTSNWKQGLRHTWSTRLPVGVHKVSFEALSRDRFSDTIDGGTVTITAPTSPTPKPTPTATPKTDPTPTPKPPPAPTHAPSATPTPAPGSSGSGGSGGTGGSDGSVGTSGSG